MAKFFKKFTAVALATLVSLTVVACGDSVPRIADEMAALPHFNGVTEDGSYDSKYFYRNDLKVFGGDPDVEWVPEDRDPEYGGYFYMYTSANDGVGLSFEPDESKSALTVLRSKDLNDWELCGAVANGFSCTIAENEWIIGQVWAPEVIYNPNDQTYYLYVTGMSPWYKDEDGYRDFYRKEDSDSDKGQYDRFFGAVFMSKTPVGPFRLATSERYYGDANQANLNGKVVTGMTPQIDFKHDCPGLKDDNDFGFGQKPDPVNKEWEGDGTVDEKNTYWGLIDMDPFFDDDGTLYVYFVRHLTTKYAGMDQQIFGMKMKDMITPDYKTMRMLISSYGSQVVYRGDLAKHEDGTPLTEDEKFEQYPPYKYSSYDVKGADENTTDNFYHRREEVTINGVKCTYKCSGEGPYMVHVGDRYYLTKTYGGFGNREYVANQTVGDSPLGPFTEIPYGPGCVVGVSQSNDFATGIGHTCYVEKDGEIFSITFAHADPFDGTSAADDGRVYCFDRITTVEDPIFGTLLYGNGPTNSLQPRVKSECNDGMTNIAGSAKITVTNAVEGTEKYLNDGRFVALEYYRDLEFESTGSTVITLEFDAPREVGAIMIYNSFDYEYAFASVDSIQFKVTETPSWYTKGEIGGVYIKDLPFNEDYVNLREGFMRAGGSALASFDPIKTDKIQIAISKKIYSASSEIRISEIVVLGK